jgi:hypothetical protein
MDPTPESQENVPVWKGDQSPCVYCGQVISRTEERCPHCRTSMSVAVRRVSREVIGPWYYLDPRNPSGRGITFEALIKMIEKGRIRHDSIVRGPTTHQDWMFAAEAPRLAKFLGVCPHCFSEARPEDTYCTHCQLNMNARPAEPRPGIPWDLIKPPVHRVAYDIERELAGTAKPSAETLEGEALDIPAAPQPSLPASPPVPTAKQMSSPVAQVRADPTPAPRPDRAEPTPPPRPVAPARVESAAMLAAAAQLATAGHGAAGQESPAEAMSAAATERARGSLSTRRPRKKAWALLLATVVLPVLTLGAIAIVLVKSGWLTPETQDKILEKAGVKNQEKGKGKTAVSPTQMATPNDAWVVDRTKELNKAVDDHDFTKAIEICESIRARSGDASWDARLAELKRQQTEDRRDRNTRLKERLSSAEELARTRQYEKAITIVKGINKEDRAFLAELGVGVDMMERQYREDQIKWDASQQKESQLKVAVDRAHQLQASKKYDEAVTVLKAIKKGYAEDTDLLQKVVPTLDADIQALDTLIAAATTKVEPKKIDPPVKVEVTPEQAKAAVADLMKQADDLEKGLKLKPALAKLQEIKTRYDKVYWPAGLDERIQKINDRIQAMIFFGLGDDTEPKKK